MKKIRLPLLVCVLVSACATTSPSDFSKAPQIEMPKMADRIAAGAICHYYTDYKQFGKNLEKLELIVDKDEKQREIRYLQLELYGECVVNIQQVVNDYKNSF
jgi:hypothetical protein